MAFKVAISAGHYIGTAGKRCAKELDPKETREWVLNDRIADKLEKILAGYDGIEILRVDDTTGKKNIALEDRAIAANNWKADLYLAIHHNAADLEKGKVFSGGGIVAYIHSTNAKKGAEAWQKAFYDACIKFTGLKGNRATPLAKKALKECSYPNCPSVLMELGFMDSRVDVPIILTDEYATNIAKALAEVIVAKSGATLKTSKTFGIANLQLSILGPGSKGAQVEVIQIILNARGYKDTTNKALVVDGSYGPATTHAVKSFQKDNGLSVDGYAGPKTLRVLFAAI
jgi:N-acetylmuramoyl-L-alanine amidase